MLRTDKISRRATRNQSMLLTEDRQLLDGYRQGDRDALGRVFRAYAPAVAAWLRSGFSFTSGGRQCRFHGVRSEFDLEDRLHDVFGRAFGDAARKGYDGLSPFATYLRTITKNLIVDDFRKKERALTEYSIEQIEGAAAPDEDAPGEPLSGVAAVTGHPDRDAGANEVIDLVARFKANLDARERHVYELRFERELEHKEIVKETGLSPAKVKTSEKRIRIAFFEFMKRHGYFAGYAQNDRGWLRSIFSL